MESFILHIFRSLTGICTFLLYIKNVRLGKALLLKAASGWESCTEQRKGSELGLSFLQRNVQKYFKGFGTSYVVYVPQRTKDFFFLVRKSCLRLFVGRVRADIWVNQGWKLQIHHEICGNISLCCLFHYWFSFPALGVGAAAPGCSWGGSLPLPGLPEQGRTGSSIPVCDCLALSSQLSCFPAPALSLYRQHTQVMTTPSSYLGVWESFPALAIHS